MQTPEIDDNQATVNGSYIDELRDALSMGGTSLTTFPALLKCVIREGRWRRYKTPRLRFDGPGSFEEFVTGAPPDRLGTTIRAVRNLIRDDPEAIELLDRALEHKPGERNDLYDNIKEVEPAPVGTSSQQAIRKLRKARPDLLEKVKAKELSPHAAMIQAGFRVRSITIPDSPKDAARRLARSFKGERLLELIAELQAFAR